MNRDHMVKEIKAQLDQYLKHSQANLNFEQIDYQFDTRATDKDGKESLADLSARKSARLDAEI